MSALNRVTTSEAARLLGVRHAEALALLKAAGARGTRAGTAILWSLADVEALRSALEQAGLASARMAVQS